MCLTANRDDPLTGKHSIKFDEKGYAICWKTYDTCGSYLESPYYPTFHVKNGWIISDRKDKKICTENGDWEYRVLNGKYVDIGHGIHVFILEKDAEEEMEAEGCAIVPVRCHKSQLVAIDNDEPVAVFMKVFLKKADYKKALK